MHRPRYVDYMQTCCCSCYTLPSLSQNAAAQIKEELQRKVRVFESDFIVSLADFVFLQSKNAAGRKSRLVLVFGVLVFIILSSYFCLYNSLRRSQATMMYCCIRRQHYLRFVLCCFRIVHCADIKPISDVDGDNEQQQQRGTFGNEVDSFVGTLNICHTAHRCISVDDDKGLQRSH